MNNIDDGGSAFPRAAMTPDGFDVEYGMTLRDYFAAKAMQGIISNSDHVITEHPKDRKIVLEGTYPENTAVIAYEYADAMLKARRVPHDRHRQKDQ